MLGGETITDFTFRVAAQTERNNAMWADEYDSLCDRALMDYVRIAPRFGVFASLDGWRVGITDLLGAYVSQLAELRDVNDACRMVRLLNQAEALSFA